MRQRRPVGAGRLPSPGGAKVDVAAIDAIHHRAQLGALGLGEGIVLGTADEGEGLARQHRIGVAAAGLDGDDLHRHVLEIALGHGDVERQIAGVVDRLRHQDFARGAGRHDASGDGGARSPSVRRKAYDQAAGGARSEGDRWRRGQCCNSVQGRGNLLHGLRRYVAVILENNRDAPSAGGAGDHRSAAHDYDDAGEAARDHQGDC